MVKKIMTFDLIHLHPKYVPTRPNGMEKYAKLCKAQFGWKRQTLLGSPNRLVVLYKLIEGPGLPSSSRHIELFKPGEDRGDREDSNIT